MISTWVNQYPAHSWVPEHLGTKLIAKWDADVTSSLVLSGASVSEWLDVIGGVNAVQSTSGFKPVLDPTGINSSAAVVFDGTDDHLTFTPAPFPGGSNPAGIWIVLNWMLPGATASPNGRGLFVYGATAGLGRRYCGRSSVTSTNRAVTATGDVGNFQAVDSAVDLLGVHVTRHQFTNNSITTTVDNVLATTTTPAANNVVGTRGRMGSNNVDPPGAFGGASLKLVLVTDGTLTASEETLMWAYLKSRGGIA
jgi:hypothetical protein